MFKRKLRGISLDHKKNTAGNKPIIIPVPKLVYIPMLMSSGKPAKPIVNVGDEVKVGQLIAEPTALVSSNVHSSVSGKVIDITDIDNISGEKAVTVIIETDGKQELFDNLLPPVFSDYEGFLKAVRTSGVVGLGGAGFPTDVKLTLKNPENLDYILINGAECEPYLTTDYYTMMNETEYLWEGILNLKKYLNLKNIVICIEENKRKAITKFKTLCRTENIPGIRVHVLKSLYPQGERKVMVYNVTGRVVPEGARLPDIGCIVINCSTVAVIGKYIKTGMPLVSKCITVDGSAVIDPKNVIAPIGTPIRDILNFCGGLKDDSLYDEHVGKVLLGGPMTGTAVPSLNIPIIKTTGGVLAFLEKDIKPYKTSNKDSGETACIKCGRCIAKCPMFLSPMNAEIAYNLEKTEQLKSLKVNLCIECGSCAYVCPAKKPLVQMMQLSNDMIRNIRTNKSRTPIEN